MTLGSARATGQRSLLKHDAMIREIAVWAAKKFDVVIYELAVCATHLHFCIRGKSRPDLQNFFRLFAGQTAQKILERFPIVDEALPLEACKKNRRKFWALLTYTRVLTWGREFRRVCNYIKQNTLEALHVSAYKPRPKPRRRPKKKSSDRSSPTSPGPPGGN